MIKKLTFMLAVIPILSSLLYASHVQHQESKAPPIVLMKPSNGSGSLLVKVFGADSIQHDFRDKMRLFIIPRDIWQAKKDLEYRNDYLVDISHSHLIRGLKPGVYIIGISTQYRRSFSVTGAGMTMELPNDFYSWDGCSVSPGLENVNGEMYYITWYTREIVPATTSLVVVMSTTWTDVTEFLTKVARDMSSSLAITNLAVTQTFCLCSVFRIDKVSMFMRFLKGFRYEKVKGEGVRYFFL